MTKFKITENGLKELQKANLKRTFAIALPLIIAVILLNYYQRGGQSEDLIALLLFIPIIGIAMGIGIFVGMKRYKKAFESYTLTISDQEIIREQLNTPTISIPFEAVKSIDKNSKGFSVRSTSSAKDIIWIPAQVENAEQLEELLSNIHPVGDEVEKTFVEKYSSLLTAISAGLVLATLASNNKFVVSICGTLVLLLLGYSFYELQTNKNIDSKTKNTSWIILLVLISIASKIYFKLTGNIIGF